MTAFQEVIARVRPVIDKYSRRRLPTFAAAGTFYMFLSLPSIVILAISLLPYTPLTSDDMLLSVSRVVPDEVMSIIEMLVESVYSGSGVALGISAVITVWSAAKGVMSLILGLRSAYGARKGVNSILLRLKAVFYILFLFVSLIVALLLLAFGEDLTILAMAHLPEGRIWGFIRRFMLFWRQIAGFAFLFLVFLLMYRFASGSGLSLRYHFYGAVLSSLGWVLISALFGDVATITSQYSIYGILGTVIAAMLWLYYSLYALLLGGYVNSCLWEGWSVR